jgi:hypothetical protein
MNAMFVLQTLFMAFQQSYSFNKFLGIQSFGSKKKDRQDYYQQQQQKKLLSWEYENGKYHFFFMHIVPTLKMNF